jgi:Transposase and inactivated derivatives
MEGCTGKEIKRQYFKSIQALNKRFSLDWLCQLYGVSRSGYYQWLKEKKRPNRYDLLHQEIDNVVMKEHSQHPSYGYRSIKAAILYKTGWMLSNYSVLKSMQRLKIQSKVRPKKNYLKGKEHPVFPNILNRQFKTEQPFEKIVTDICQFRSRGVRYYFAAYLDLFNNEIISWSLGLKDNMPLVLNALNRVIEIKEEGAFMMLHSDQGSQYASYPYVNILKQNHIFQSMSRAGTPHDNAVMESCFGWFKDMLKYDFDIRHCVNIKDTLAKAVEYYNFARPAYALNYKTPAQFKAEQGF